MKKIMTMMIAAAMATALFASCGKVVEQGGEDISSAAETAAEEDNASPEESAAETTAPEKEEFIETTAPEDESEPEETTTSKAAADPVLPETSITKHQWLLQTISFDSYFEPDNYRFHELVYQMGLANAYDEGKAYAIVPAGGGAGHVYYDLYYTEDGGDSWTQGEPYDEISGDSRHFALEDGGIMLFSLHSARAETYPVVTYLSFDGAGVKAEELEDAMAQIVLNDGRLLSEAEGVEYDLAYRYDYVFKITITDSKSGETLFSDDVYFFP